MCRATAVSRRSSSTTARRTIRPPRPGRMALQSSFGTRSARERGSPCATAGRRGSGEAGHISPSSMPTINTSRPSWPARSITSWRMDADYVQGSRWMRGGRVEGPTGARGPGTRPLPVPVQRPRPAPDQRRHERIPDLPGECPRRPFDRPAPGMAHELRPGLASWYKVLRGRYLVHRTPSHRALPHRGLHQDGWRSRLVAAVSAGRPAALRPKR